MGRAEVVSAGLRADRACEGRRWKSGCRIRRRRRSPYIDGSTSASSGAARSIAMCVRMVTNDRNIYAASMLAAGDVDAMVTGVTRNYATALNDVRQVIDPLARRHAPSASGDLRQAAGSCSWPIPPSPKCRTSEQLADIAIQAAATARKLRHDPARGDARLLHLRLSALRTQRAHRRGRSYSGYAAAWISNMTARWRPMWRSIPAGSRSIPSARITDTANVLIMPAMHSASISTKLLQQLGGANVMGPLLVGLEKSGADHPAGRQDERDLQRGHRRRL